MKLINALIIASEAIAFLTGLATIIIGVVFAGAILGG